MIYEPAEDSYLLKGEVRKFCKDKRVLDMGAGSGIQALTAKEGGALSVLACDIDIRAVNELKKKGINAVLSDLFFGIKKKFDLIIFNPPYLPEDKREDAESARNTSGGKRGDEIILRFLKDAGKHLNTNGAILLIVSSLTPKNRILSVLRRKDLKKKIITEKKIFMESLEVWKIGRKLIF